MERFKSRNLVDPFRPSRKCGAEVAAAMALSNMALSAYSADRAAVQQTNALNASAAENQKNREFQAEQASINRQYNTGERLAQQEYQTAQLQTLMQYNKQLQSPQYQSQQLQSAGINPAVYFSNHSTFNGGASPGANAPSGSGVPGTPSGSSGLTSVNPVVPDWASSMMVGANIAKTMSEAGMNKSQTDLILQKVFTEQLVQDTMKIDNMIKQAKYPAEVKKLWTEIKSEVVKQGLMEWQGKKYKSDIDLNESIQKLNKALENKNDQETLLLKRNLWELIDNYGLRKEVIASEGAKNRGFASEASANASFTRYQESMERALEAGKIEMFWDQVRKSYSDEQISEHQVSYAEALKRSAETAADHAEALFWQDYILDWVQGGLDVAKTAIDWRNSSSWKRLSESSQRRVDARLKELQMQYGDKVELEDVWNGTKRKRTYHSSNRRFD